MKKLIYILFILFITQSYSQENDLDVFKYDDELQLKYSDTIKKIEERLNGKWKYLGKKTDGILIDTISFKTRNEKGTYTIVKNGDIFELIGMKEEKMNYILEVTYNFKDKRGFYSINKKYLKDDITEIRTCEPIPQVIFCNDKLGILFIGMAGENFNEITELSLERLIFGNGKEYLKLE